ncbi:Multidrug resistance-associated protein 1, variant 2 [Schistosoma haematobium]|nr:Multidrug resistance-associated protein 1, variant 2 [Schistosoma haematobium]KAH9589496.1 Multidrug resistance-associated protein 1, variant 2 [Schistosoma haematobium]
MKEIDHKSPINDQSNNHLIKGKTVTTNDELNKSIEINQINPVMMKSSSSSSSSSLSSSYLCHCFSIICIHKMKFSLLYALMKTYGKTLLWSAFLKFLYDILVFVNPLLLKLLLNFLQNTQSEPIWHGYLYAIAIFIDTSVQSLILQSYFHIVFKLGMNIKTAITAAVYRKSLRLSNKARYQSTTGQIMNLMSSDAQQFVQLMPFINILWSGPFQITIAMVFLWRELGPSVLAGVGVLLLLLPLNVLVARRSKIFQEKKSSCADSRIKFINELMNGIRVLKLYAWEPSFMREIGLIRDQEVKYLRKFTYLQSLSFLWHCTPFFVAISSFGVYILTSDKNILDAQKAFVSLSLFNILRFPLFMFPMIISNLAQCYVSIGRLTKFLAHTELDMESYSKEDTPGIAAVVERGVFGWDPDEEPTLTNISIQFPEGQLTTIMGSVGSGKSSLLHALLGDMENFNGRVNVKGTVAYVPQQPWIYNATLRDNILFHHSYEPIKYQQVLHACNLIPDLDLLPNGDMTEIGDKGINLSGGQKQRVSLARACYADADVYLLDDPLSAVDAHVGLHLLKYVLSRSNGLLASKTCILTTHSPKALPFSDRVGLMSDGQIIELGNYQQLIHSNNSRLSAFLITAIRAESEVQSNSSKELVDCSPENLKKEFLEPSCFLPFESSPVSEHHHKSSTETLSIDNHNVVGQSSFTSTGLSRRLDKSSIIEVSDTEDTVKEQEQKTIQPMSQPEKVLTGRIQFQVFLIYIKNIGLLYSLLVLLFYPFNHLLSLGTNLWLADWSNDAKINQYNLSFNNITSEQFYSQRNYRLSIYALFGTLQVLFAMLSIYTLSIGHLGCVIRLHSRLLSYVLHAPATFFDLVPHGRIVNRFSQDIATLDNPVLVSLNSTLNCVLTCFLTLCLACTLNIYMIIPICLLTIIYLYIQNLYVTTSRQLKRLESISLSPIFSHFSETLSGVDSIRAYKLIEIYKTISSTRQDLNNSAVYASIISQRWLAVLLELVGNSVILAVAILSVVAQGYLSAGFSGLVITYALNLNQTLNWLVRMFSELETNIVCIERIHEYSSIEQEAPWELDCSYLPSNWPEGIIEFINYGTKYRSELNLALKSINFKVDKGEKLGIVGRTGSGKSSLVLGLFRMLEAAEGKILIDGYDISKIGLHDLRNRLTLIPQDPILFSGTLRFNLDPFNHYTDEAIWHALELANLKSFIKDANNNNNDANYGLDMNISEGGSNISLGQRQLVCLARALLRHTSILVLDEATAAIDMQTDNLIQETIRREFSSCTVITIAHRLNTVLDYDRILVLEDGQMKELDSPKMLLQNKNSAFYSLAKDAHLVE